MELNKLLYKTAGVNISLNKDIIDLIEKISSGNKELLSAIIFTSKGILLRKECDSGPMRYKSFKFQNKKNGYNNYYYSITSPCPVRHSGGLK